MALLGAGVAGVSTGQAATAEGAPDAKAEASKLCVYFGTYSGKESQGIYTSDLSLADGKLSEPRLAAEAVNPSFVAIHPNRRFLYAVGEVSDLGGKQVGGVTAFAIDPKSGDLKKLNQKSSGGGGPCHLSVDATGKCVVVANYGGGSVASLPIKPDGSLGEAASFIQHKGSSVDPARQKEPHAHSANFDPANRFAIVADLGLDKLLVYRVDPQKAKLAPNDPPFATTPAGGGPRHLAFHPNGKFAYANNEMTSSVTAYSYDAERGVFEPLQTLSTLPADFTKENSTAEVRVHPNGKFAYVSNRGYDSIASFAIDPSTGQLTAAGHQSTGGRVPRNFNLDPSGRWLLAANQDTHNVVVLAVDEKTGQLTPTGNEIKVGSPVCVRFWEPAK
ncbi:MAG TPA: lactonase family protein [Pirellulales bacterium]